jgi:isopentenyl diphosphate isomerase/L-lactate dehydrogenase-like FMN-dependent dehydrogenase
MSPRHIDFVSRRRLLQFLAASPLFAHNALAEGLRPSDPVDWAPRDLDKPIADPTQALDVFDFEPVMRKNVPPAHFGYMATGVDDEVTLRANREGFRKFELRPRRFVDVGKIDMSADILGTKYDSPIVLAPVGSNRAFHPDAEIAVAKAAKAGNHLQILSTVATTSIEDAIAARGAPLWFQLYTTQRWEIAEGLVRRAEAAGAPVTAVTLDVRSPAEWETFVRLWRTDTRECGSCHGLNTYLSRKPNFTGIDLGGVSSTVVTNLTWDLIKRLRDTVKVKLVLKGILAFEDAKLAADAGIDAIVVSNHGNRPGGRRPHADPGRQRLSPRQRHRQSPGNGRASGMYRPALSLGSRRFRSARCRARPCNPARRDSQRHGAAWRADAQRPHAGDGPASLSRSSSCPAIAVCPAQTA